MANTFTIILPINLKNFSKSFDLWHDTRYAGRPRLCHLTCPLAICRCTRLYVRSQHPAQFHTAMGERKSPKNVKIHVHFAFLNVIRMYCHNKCSDCDFFTEATIFWDSQHISSTITNKIYIMCFRDLSHIYLPTVPRGLHVPGDRWRTPGDAIPRTIWYNKLFWVCIFICSRVHNRKTQNDFYQCLPCEGYLPIPMATKLTKYTVPGYNVSSDLYLGFRIWLSDLMLLPMTQRLDMNSYLRVNVKVYT